MAEKRVPIEKFLTLYLKAHDEGITREEFAKSIGIKPTTVYQRIYELRQENEGIPMLRTAGRMSRKDKVQEIMATYLAKKPAKKQPAATKPAEKPDAVDAAVVEENDPLADILR